MHTVTTHAQPDREGTETAHLQHTEIYYNLRQRLLAEQLYICHNLLQNTQYSIVLQQLFSITLFRT